MKNQPFYRRVRYALAGVRTAFLIEASFRIQTVFAGAAVLLLIVLRPKPVWWALVLLTVGAVLAAELVNTALEYVVDRLHPEADPVIGKAKDCAAGAVLILSAVSLLVTAALLVETFS